MNNYIVKESKSDGSIIYHLSGHSRLLKGVKKLSHHYTYATPRGAKLLISTIQKEYPDCDSTFDIVECKAEGIEVC